MIPSSRVRAPTWAIAGAATTHRHARPAGPTFRTASGGSSGAFRRRRSRRSSSTPTDALDEPDGESRHPLRRGLTLGHIRGWSSRIGATVHRGRRIHEERDQADEERHDDSRATRFEFARTPSDVSYYRYLDPVYLGNCISTLTKAWQYCYQWTERRHVMFSGTNKYPSYHTTVGTSTRWVPSGLRF